MGHRFDLRMTLVPSGGSDMQQAPHRLGGLIWKGPIRWRWLCPHWFGRAFLPPRSTSLGSMGPASSKRIGTPVKSLLDTLSKLEGHKADGPNGVSVSPPAA